MAVTYRCQGYKKLAQGCAQASTNTTAVITSSELEASGWQSIQYTLTAYGNAIKWSVFGDNDPAFGTEVAVQAATTVAAGAAGVFLDAAAAYAWYRVKLIDDVLNTHGNVTLTAVLQG